MAISRIFRIHNIIFTVIGGSLTVEIEGVHWHCLDFESRVRGVKIPPTDRHHRLLGTCVLGVHVANRFHKQNVHRVSPVAMHKH